ncbi:MAG: hypothetical protein M4579_002402 [Chaenotheca gracillima]|nr:MAG: hypothetical protein M4579_002402 [Chaenotheca gracillima]
MDVPPPNCSKERFSVVERYKHIRDTSPKALGSMRDARRVPDRNSDHDRETDRPVTGSRVEEPSQNTQHEPSRQDERQGRDEDSTQVVEFRLSERERLDEEPAEQEESPQHATSTLLDPYRDLESWEEPLIDLDSTSRQRFPTHISNFSGENVLPLGRESGVETVPHLLDMDEMDSNAQRKGKLGPGGIPHERTDAAIADRIRAILESSNTEAEQAELHFGDQDAAWFGVFKDELNTSIFQDYGRYADIIANEFTGQLSSRTPSFVSFVGQSGAGKSSLIKLLVELNGGDSTSPSTPVVGSVHNQDIPTSGDVHLYSDPLTASGTTPVLYADCEGLDGGEREPLSARTKRLHREGAQRATTNGHKKKRSRQIPDAPEREITWADTAARQSRQFVVSNLYPRLLYTFSDVIVFVLKNPRTIESVIEILIDWAAAALETSSNQPVLPHAIIVLNASENALESWNWNVDDTTAWLINSVESAIFQSDKFKKYVDFWQERNKTIDSTANLLEAYYSSVRIVRVPQNGRPKLIKEQVGRLYQEIAKDCRQSRESKRSLRMLLDASEVQPYLQYAFDHFSCNLDTPFDFVKASFSNNPIPPDFGGNILKLAINLMEKWERKLDGPAIFRELSFMVASCIMLDSARHKTRGTAEKIFPEYVHHCDDALEDFCNRHWPCEYISRNNGRHGQCVNVRSGHGAKGHQLKNGKVFAWGSYQSLFSVETHQEIFRNHVYRNLVQLLDDLRVSAKRSHSEEATAAAIHQKAVMDPFYRHVGQADGFISHSTCLSCLMSPPEHLLPCGHVLCTPCLKAYGIVRKKVEVELRACPLHKAQTDWMVPWIVTLKPSTAGVRILTLDGGGIKGLMQLEVLKRLEHTLGGNIPIQAFFDLIVGTGSGGIIAMGLGVKNWRVSACTAVFENLMKSAFTPRRGSKIPGVAKFVENRHNSKYETQPLEKALRESFSESELMFGGSRTEERITRVAVTASSVSGEPTLLTNYNRSCEEKLPYHFQRPEKPSLELKTWEAARATFATPSYFKTFEHKPSRRSYQDDALRSNNPIQMADSERKLTWPNAQDSSPDIVLSLGTGSLSEFSRSFGPQPTSPLGGIFNRNQTKMQLDNIGLAGESERMWNEFIELRREEKRDDDRYHRIDPELRHLPRPDDLNSFAQLQCDIRDCAIPAQSLRNIASQLLSSCFYFEQSGRPRADIIFVEGLIQCRFQSHEDELRNLGMVLKDAKSLFHSPHFTVTAKENGETETIFIDDRTIELMTVHQRFKMPALNVRISSDLVRARITFSLHPDLKSMISGFPRSLLEENSQASFITSRGKSTKWRNHTKSQLKRRGAWAGPRKFPGSDLHHDISLFSAPHYLIGDSAEGVHGKISNPLKDDIVELANTEIPIERNEMD